MVGNPSRKEPFLTVNIQTDESFFGFPPQLFLAGPVVFEVSPIFDLNPEPPPEWRQRPYREWLGRNSGAWEDVFDLCCFFVGSLPSFWCFSAFWLMFYCFWVFLAIWGCFGRAECDIVSGVYRSLCFIR